MVKGKKAVDMLLDKVKKVVENFLEDGIENVLDLASSKKKKKKKKKKEKIKLVK